MAYFVDFHVSHQSQLIAEFQSKLLVYDAPKYSDVYIPVLFLWEFVTH